jgi:hypothetical protein
MDGLLDRRMDVRMDGSKTWFNGEISRFNQVILQASIEKR